MIGGEEVILKVMRSVIQQRSRAGTAAQGIADGVDGDRLDLIAPGIALRADFIDFAGAFAAAEKTQLCPAIITLVDAANFNRRLRSSGGYKDLDDDLISGDHRGPKAAGATTILCGVGALHVEVPWIVNPELRAFRQFEVGKPEVETLRGGRLYAQSPQSPVGNAFP